VSLYSGVQSSRYRDLLTTKSSRASGSQVFQNGLFEKNVYAASLLFLELVQYFKCEEIKNAISAKLQLTSCPTGLYACVKPALASVRVDASVLRLLWKSVLWQWQHQIGLGNGIRKEFWNRKNTSVITNWDRRDIVIYQLTMQSLQRSVQCQSIEFGGVSSPALQSLGEDLRHGPATKL
jgi:hypothetical protein